MEAPLGLLPTTSVPPSSPAQATHSMNMARTPLARSTERLPDASTAPIDDIILTHHDDADVFMFMRNGTGKDHDRLGNAELADPPEHEARSGLLD